MRNINALTSGWSSLAALALCLSAAPATAQQLCNGCISGKQIKNGDVTAADLANNAVTSNKLKNNAVTGAKLQNNAVTSSKLKNNAVTEAKLKNNAVTSNKLKNGAVTAAKLRDGAITSKTMASAERTVMDYSKAALNGAIVGCASGGTISEALAQGALDIQVRGICNENVEITRDDVTLRAAATGGTVNGQITVNGARRVLIEGLTIRGAGAGLFATANADVTLMNAAIAKDGANGGDDGVVANNGALVVLADNTITSATHCAVRIVDGAVAELEDNAKIESQQADPNLCAALVVARASVRLRGGNVIENHATGGHALQILHGASVRQGEGFDRVVGFVELRNVANGDFREVLIEGASPAVSVHEGANLRIGGSGAPSGLHMGTSVLGNVELFTGAMATVSAPLTINGTVYSCQGTVHNDTDITFIGGGAADPGCSM